MIRAKHVAEELEKAKKDVVSSEGKALLKVLEVISKVVLSTRLMVDKVRDKLGVPKVERRRPEEKDPKLNKGG